MNRRDFIQTTAAGAASGLILPPSGVHAAPSRRKPRRVGLIGAGWYGKVDLIRLLQVEPEVEVVSVCDPDSAMLADALAMIAMRQASKKTPRGYADYRPMLAEKDLDLVLIETPDHWHALPMIAAVEGGADVFLQKPISIDVAEGKAMLDAARRTGRVVQVNTQRRSTAHLAEARDRVIRDGKLGRIGLVEIYCYYHMRSKGNPPDTNPPANLNYDLWTGPAPLRPYNSMVHPRTWRAFTEYSNGILGDMCVHMLDMVRWMMGLGWPKIISSAGGTFVEKGGKANIPDTQTATFGFDGLDVVWQHRSWGDAPDPKYPWGATFYGEKGTLKASVHSYDFTPAGGGQPLHGEVKYEFDEYPEDRTEKDLERHVAPAIRAHLRNWLDCVETRQRPVADIEEGHISTASCILANNALRLGRALTWDPVAHKVVGDDEANGLLLRPYRGPYVHPALGRV